MVGLIIKINYIFIEYFSKTCLGDTTNDCLSCFSKAELKIKNKNKGYCNCPNNLIWDQLLNNCFCENSINLFINNTNRLLLNPPEIHQLCLNCTDSC